MTGEELEAMLAVDALSEKEKRALGYRPVKELVQEAIEICQQYPEFLAYEGYKLVKRNDENIVSLSDAVRIVKSEKLKGE